MLNSTLVSGSYSPRVSKKKIRKKWAVSRWCNFDQYYFKIMIFVVISFNATFPSVFWEEGGGGGLNGKSAYAQHQRERRGPSLELG